MELAKWQRNDVFEAVQKAGLSPDEFEWEAGGPNESTLHHLQSGAWFLFGGNAGGYATRYSAGDGPIDERKSASWFGVTRQVELWLSAVKRDIETPDMWAQLQRDREVLAAVSDEAIDNTPFTPADRQEIAEQLQELKDHISRVHSLSDEQARLLDERVAYLVDAAGRVGRKDWFLMAGGAMLSYVLAAALPPDSATHILETLSHEHRAHPVGRPTGTARWWLIREVPRISGLAGRQ